MEAVDADDFDYKMEVELESRSRMWWSSRTRDCYPGSAAGPRATFAFVAPGLIWNYFVMRS